MKPLLSVLNITKEFPGVIANDQVAFDVQPGEIHCLLGENGAGKSTLVKIIYGLLHPDAGQMFLNGKAFNPSTPSDARDLGVGMVFQNFSLFEALTVSENIALCLDSSKVDKNLDESIAGISRSYGLPLEPLRRVCDLSVGERQRVEIVRCLLQKPRLLIMDEPTSVLTPQEIEILFKTLKKLSAEGCAILYISHKLEEIRSLCHAATVLRGGKVVGTCDPRNETAKSLAALMIGESLKEPKFLDVNTGDVKLEIDNLNMHGEDQFSTSLEDISLEVRSGEILGIAGVAGNGQDELIKALVGENLSDRPNAIRFDGQPIGDLGPTERRRLGMCFIPEERLGHGAAPDMTLWENALVTARTCLEFEKKLGLLDNKAAWKFSEMVVAAFQVKTAGVGHAAKSLSGGNLQKFLVGREIMQNPGVLIVSQPTWGVDAGAAVAIHQTILDLATTGTAVLVVSQDLDELMTISSRFAVIAGGRISEARPAGEMSIEEIGLLMGGKAHEAMPQDEYIQRDNFPNGRHL